jgi:hypothetical protein
MNPEILEMRTEQIVLEFPKDDYPGLLIAYLPPTPQIPGGGTGSSVIGQPLTVTTDGQTLFPFTGSITNPAATWLEVNHDAHRYGTDYLLDLGTSTLTWLGLFKLEIGDQITFYS